MIYFNKLANANDVKIFGQWSTVYNQIIILSKTTNFDSNILNLVIFFRSSEFFFENVVTFAEKPVAALRIVNLLMATVRSFD